jgi:hypothetical protein
MHRIKSILFFVLIPVSSGFSSDKIGSLFIGLDYLPDNEYNETASGVYRLQKSGLTAGFFIPLGFPYVDAHYKVKASTHPIEKRAWDWQGAIQKSETALYDWHASALNEILFGKEMRAGRDVSILPQLGLGFQLDALNQNGDSHVGGIVYSGLFSDFSSRIRFPFKHFGVEAIVNYQLCLIPSWSGYEATDRLALAFAVFK